MVHLRLQKTGLVKGRLRLNTTLFSDSGMWFSSMGSLFKEQKGIGQSSSAQ